MFRQKQWIWLVIWGLVLGLVACQSGTGDEAEASNQLIIYSGRSESLVGTLIEQFQAETGIEVKVRYGGTAELAATLMEEGKNSPADMFFAQDPGGLGAVANAGMLAKLPDSLLAEVPARFIDDEREWVGISGRARVIVYNTDQLEVDELPADIWDFIEPQWQGRIGWAPTNASLQAMVTAMRSIWGEEKTRAWLEGIEANHPIAYANNTAVVAAVEAGEVEVGFVNHYYLYRFLAEEGEEFAARNYFLPTGGPGSLILVAGAGILRTATHPTQAEQFIEFMLSSEGQQYFADETYEYPVIAGIEINPLLTPLVELDKQAIHIDLGNMSDLEGTAQLLSDLGILP